MTDRPILYRTEMVKAIMAGLKTQTRRPAWKPVEPWEPGEQIWEPGGGSYTTEKPPKPKPTHWQKVQPGDRLWVRETWGAWPGLMSPIDYSTVVYRADDPPISNPNWRWRPNIHMPRDLSRLTLVVQDSRTERLRDITEDDAIAEGMGVFPQSMSATKRFREIWEAIHGASNWEANPEVVVITTHTVRCNIDRLGAAA